jgi:hypothetical protein
LRNEYETRKHAVEKLISETPISHVPRPLAVVDIGYGGVGKGHIESTKDAEMAVSFAVLYWVTHRPEYVDMAIKIIKAWSITNTVWRGDNALLEASWVVCSFARAAELIKYCTHKDRRDTWCRDIEPLFFKWIDSVIMPVLRSEHIWKWDIVNNWHFSQICARMQLAILREQKSEWDWCIKKCPGETTETCRDVTHAQMQLGGIIQAAEMAHHQGVNLFDDRLWHCFELQASIMMKEIPAGLTKADIKTPYGYWYEPVWHIAHAHFTKRRKRPMPKTEAYIKQIGPDRVCFHWGPNYITHYMRLSV